jgi:uncharacterized protein YndB with AHSA1/START domain
VVRPPMSIDKLRNTQRRYQLTKDAEERVVRKAVHVNAGVEDVWDAIVSFEKIKQWLNGTDVDSSWTIGSAITFSGTLHGVQYRDKGTILDFKDRKVLKYSHWSRLSRLPDAPGNYSVITMTVEPRGGQTIFSVTHEHFASEAAYKHSNFHWAVTLKFFKEFVESEVSRAAERAKT